MPQIHWDESFSIGNEDLDNQHKKWIALYNKVDKIMSESSSTEFSKLKFETLQEMKEYATYHFRYEENFMKEIDFPELPKHWRLHKDFDYKVFDYIRQIECNEIVLNSDILAFIRDWLVSHILKEDMKIRQYQERH